MNGHHVGGAVQEQTQKQSMRSVLKLKMPLEIQNKDKVLNVIIFDLDNPQNPSQVGISGSIQSFTSGELPH